MPLDVSVVSGLTSSKYGPGTYGVDEIKVDSKVIDHSYTSDGKVHDEAIVSAFNFIDPAQQGGATPFINLGISLVGVCKSFGVHGGEIGLYTLQADGTESLWPANVLAATGYAAEWELPLTALYTAHGLSPIVATSVYMKGDPRS